MSFASPLFLWYFMPATLAAYWALPARRRNYLLAVVSLLFYASGGGAFVVMLMACIVVNFAAGLAIDAPAAPARRRQAILVAAIAFDVGVLGIWKYAGFASRQFSVLTQAVGGSGTPIVKLALPIGISFFTFHHLSYVVDVYRGSRRAQRSPVQFVTYIAMFPQLVAGPIVRYHEIADQLAEVRDDRLADFAAGFPRFALGLAKKVVVADTIAPVADAAFRSGSGGLTTATAWVGVLTYTLQIYFDFSGYSDMAIGLGRMFGFTFPENFRWPYVATSVTAFWRRWHISLSTWFRDYLYIPLGGNRGRAATTYRNLLVVFVLTGFWHGANWTFLIWGLYHGALLVAERLTGAAGWADDKYAVPRRAVTLLLVMVGWVFFRSPDLPGATNFLGAMFSDAGTGVSPAVDSALTNRVAFVICAASAVVLLPRGFVLGPLVEFSPSRRASVSRLAIASGVAAYAGVLVAAGTFSPFLYAQF
ncbi:MAG: MBOAT family protein [Mycobacteriales bacterium]